MLRVSPRALRSLPLLGAALALAGCGSLLRPDYTPPALDVPAQWQSVTPGLQPAAVVTGGTWWQHFQDPTLDALVDTALGANADLAAAALRVRRAQLQAGIAEDNRWPRLSGNLGASANRQLESGTETTRNYSTSLGVSYELDLWGKVAAQADAAAWEAEATAQDRDSAALSLVGTTLNLYWRIAFLHQRLATNAQSLELALTTQQLVQAQYDAGAVSGLEIAEAEQNVLSQRNTREQILQQLQESRNALAIVLGRTPEAALPTIPQALPEQPLPAVTAGLPSSLLTRRPDLRAAELRLRQTLDSGYATRASFYPTLSLTGSLGSASNVLSQVLQNPVLALGSGLSLPFLQWNQMQLNRQITELQYEEAVVNFRQRWLQALAEVEDALNARARLTTRAELLAQALEAARVTERLYEARYRAGAVALKTWLDAQERLRSAELAVAENRLDRYSNQVTLYLALGGDTLPAAVPAADPLTP